MTTKKHIPVYSINGYEVFKRTFEAKNFPVGSDERKKLNLSSITSEYMTSYKYSIIADKFSSGKPTKSEAIEFANRLAKQKM